VLGLVLFNTFVSNMDSGIECTLSKFVDNTKLCGAVDMLEGRYAIHRDLDRFERRACAKLMKFNKAKGKVLHMYGVNPKHTYGLGREWIKSSPAKKDVGVLEAQHDSAMCARSPESQLYPGLNQKSHGQQVKGGDSATLFHAGEIPPVVLHPALEPSAQERHGPVGVGPEQGHKSHQRDGTPLL